MKMTLFGLKMQVDDIIMPQNTGRLHFSALGSRRGSYALMGTYILICLPSWVSSTVGENIIATTKIRNNHGAIQSLKFSILR